VGVATKAEASECGGGESSVPTDQGLNVVEDAICAVKYGGYTVEGTFGTAMNGLCVAADGLCGAVGVICTAIGGLCAPGDWLCAVIGGLCVPRERVYEIDDAICMAFGGLCALGDRVCTTINEL